MKKSTALFQQLEQRIHQLYEQYSGLGEKKINAKFDRTLFGEDNQSFSYYLAQVNQTLSQIAHYQDDDADKLNFLTQKLCAQCTALSEAVSITPKSYKSAVNFKPVLSAREQRKQEIHKLPPRERLAKYYDALQALNEKIDKIIDQHQQAHDVEKSHYTELLKITKERRQRCLDAIELLEEYLAFKETDSENS